MNSLLNKIILIIVSMIPFNLNALEWSGPGWNAFLGKDGCVDSICFDSSYKAAVRFFDYGSMRGPSFYISENGRENTAKWEISKDADAIETSIDGIMCELTYLSGSDHPQFEVSITNLRHTPFQPQKAGLRLGIDTYMDKYPQWLDKFFPTLLLCEKTHFHGYMQAPSGRVLLIASPQSVGSWSVDYNLGYQNPAPYWFMGHRIESVNIDLMSALPLPPRHPQNLWNLNPGESRKWCIHIKELESNRIYATEIARLINVPMVIMDETSTISNRNFICKIIADKPEVIIEGPAGVIEEYELRKLSAEEYELKVSPAEVGEYTITLKDRDKITEAKFLCRTSWRSVMERAREAVAKYQQKPTSHVESWYGFHTAFLAAKYFPDSELDSKLDNRFEYIFTKCFGDSIVPKPKHWAWRIQNVSSTIGMLADRFEAYGHQTDLNRGAAMADWLIDNCQQSDGAFVTDSIVYTSVIYMAKSLLEFADVERSAGMTDEANRHESAAYKSIQQLITANGDFNTEGELTFEDGMISCSALQIALMALRVKDPATQEEYTQTALSLLKNHDCLTQLNIADGRRRGGTLRYWEAQYDVLMLPNMFSSPHGWSAWRAYATYYMYLLTGEERWLRETFNAASSLANLVDPQSGDLRWAFIVDPRLEVRQVSKAAEGLTADSLSLGNPHPDMYQVDKFVIGEQYIRPISDWQPIVCSDNDVHEVFKFIAEAVLCNAFLIERPDGTFGTYNCSIINQGKKMLVTADEPQIRNLHVNLLKPRKIEFDGNITLFPEHFNK